jgi:HSP20 family protein
MSRLTVSSPLVPGHLKSMLRQWVQPWRMEERLFDAMFRPDFSLLDPSLNQSFDSMARRFSNAMRVRESLLGGMDVNVDVVEKNGAYQVRADLPGMKKEDINVRIDGNVVNIEAKTQQSSEEKDSDGKLLFNERYYGSVFRSFALDQEIDETKAIGKYSDGVLTLELPKKPGEAKAESKPIAIQ